MSHRVVIKTKVTDIELFKEILGQYGFTWCGESVRGGYRAKYGDLYVYFYDDEEGAITSWNTPGLRDLLRRLEAAHQDYLARKVEQDALANGFSVVRRESLEDGTVEIVLEDLS